MGQSSAGDALRCPWCGSDPLYQQYHDQEWGVPVWDSRDLFRKFTLDGFQAGLSWLTILRRTEGFDAAFEGFDPRHIAAYGDDDRTRLLGDARIIRNRQKVDAAIKNAKAWCVMESGGESFSAFLWSFVGGEPLINHWKIDGDVPATTPQSEAMSKALRQRGFGFCGPTICYAFMQAVGMVNDHLVTCHCRDDGTTNAT